MSGRSRCVTGGSLFHGVGLLFPRVPALFGANQSGGGELRAAMEPADQHGTTRERARLARQVGKHGLRRILRPMPVAPRLPQRHGIDQPDPPSHQLGKGRLRSDVGVAAQQVGVLGRREFGVILSLIHGVDVSDHGDTYNSRRPANRTKKYDEVSAGLPVPQWRHHRFCDPFPSGSGSIPRLTVAAKRVALGRNLPAMISFKLNDKPVRLEVDANRSLLWVLRTDLGLTGTKFGCGASLCGACTVLVNQKAVRTCLMTVKEVQDKEVITIEGLAKNGEMHPLQKAFMAHDALQCGFCTSGMILTAYSLLRANPQPTEAQIVQGMDQNLCRCGAHVRIVQAIQTAAAEMKGAS